MRILVTLPVEDRHKELLEKQGKNAEFIYCLENNLTKDLVQSGDIILGKAPVSMITGSPNLKWIQLGSAGTEGYCTDGVIPEKALLTNASGAYGFAISEHMVGMIFMLRKKLHLYYANQLKANWSNEGEVKAIHGSTVVVLGMGDIGSEFAKRMKALGCYIIGVKRRISQKPDFADELHLISELDAILPRADILAITLPGTKETTHMINSERISKMKTTAVIMNAGRGQIIDTNALCEALNSNQLGGAALDVIDPEPLPPTHPLWSAPNTIITPHVSGGFSLPETLDRIIQICARNLKAFTEEKDMENIVDLRTGYRK